MLIKNLTYAIGLLLLLANISCTIRSANEVTSYSEVLRKPTMKYLLVRRNAGTVDTIYMTVLAHDSIESAIRLKYHFDSHDSNLDDYEQEFVLPTELDSTGIGHTSLVDIVKLEFEG